MEALFFSVLVGVGVFFVFWSRALGGRLDPVHVRLQQIAVRARNLEELELQRPISERTLKPIISGLIWLLRAHVLITPAEAGFAFWTFLRSLTSTNGPFLRDRDM